jgi:membrane-bound lytic murein transglycosylase B
MFTHLFEKVEGNIKQWRKATKNKNKKFKGVLKKNKKHFEKIIAFTMVAKIMGMSLVLAVTPIALEGQTFNNGGNYIGSVKMDTKKSMPLVMAEKNIEFKIEPKPVAKPEPIKPAPKVRRPVISRDRVAPKPVAPAPVDPGLSAKRELVKRAAAQYNIPWKILEAVWQVESGKSWNTGKCSHAGACGPMQFMRGTWNKYGVDANGDGVANITNAEDAVFGGAKYLAANGADRGQIDNALFRYNHSQKYVNLVIGIANSIKD